ncbi:MAG: hypothetical protein AAGJ35_14695, partial [Myxococcota bacterium]
MAEPLAEAKINLETEESEEADAKVTQILAGTEDNGGSLPTPWTICDKQIKTSAFPHTHSRRAHENTHTHTHTRAAHTNTTTQKQTHKNTSSIEARTPPTQDTGGTHSRALRDQPVDATLLCR